MQDSTINIWNKVSMTIFALAPILSWYKIPFPVSLGYALILFLGVLVVVNNHFKIRVLPWPFIPLFLYICGQWCYTHNFETWTLLPPGGWIFFIFVVGLIGGVIQFDLELLKKYMKWIVWISIPLFWIQFVLYRTTGSQQVCFVPHLTNEFTYEGLTYSEVVHRHLMSSHPCSIFLEKSYMAYYLVAYLCLVWFSGNRRGRFFSKEVAVIVFTLICLRSGSGFVGLAVILVAKVFSIFWEQNSVRKILMILLLIPFSIGVFYAYKNTESGQEIISRHEELSTESTSGHSRVIAGYLLFDMMTPAEQMFGKPDARDVFGTESADGTKRFYINGVQTILIYLGYIGILLYLIFYGVLFRHITLVSKMCIVILLTMALLESNYLNPFMLLLTIIPCGDYWSLEKMCSSKK